MKLYNTIVRVMNSEIKLHKIATFVRAILKVEYNTKKSVVINYIAKLYSDKEIDFKMSGIRLAHTFIT